MRLYTSSFRNRKVEKYIFVWLIVAYFRWKRVIHCHLQVYTPSFRNRKRGALKSVNKRFSRLKRRRESVASSPHSILSSVKLFPRFRSLLSSLANAPHCSIWGSVRSQTVRRKCYFLYSHAVNRTHFFNQLAYGKMTLLNFSFLFGWCKVKFFLYFIFANGFHFPKLPFVLNFHSLLRHLFIFEFAVLLFDCERYKPAAESSQQLYFYLRATKVFCSFSSEKRVPLAFCFLCSFLFKKKARNFTSFLYKIINLLNINQITCITFINGL